MAKKKKQERGSAGASTDSQKEKVITQIPQPSPPVVTNDKVCNGNLNSGGGPSVSSFDRKPTYVSTTRTIEDPAVFTTHEPYRPTASPLSHERVNPFNIKSEPNTSSIYSPTPVSVTAQPTIIPDVAPSVTYTPKSATSSFDYSYKLPASSTRTESVEQVEKKSDVDRIFGDQPKKLERQGSDADIIFGNSKPSDPYPAYSRYSSYNKSSTSFSTSMSTESESIYANKRTENTFNTSLSVSSDKDADFSTDPTVLASRNSQGISNNAFSDFETPKSSDSPKKWHDEDYDLK